MNLNQEKIALESHKVYRASVRSRHGLDFSIENETVTAYDENFEWVWDIKIKKSPADLIKAFELIDTAFDEWYTNPDYESETPTEALYKTFRDAGIEIEIEIIPDDIED